MTNEEIIEIFGKKLRIVKDYGSESECEKCALNTICGKTKPELPCPRTKSSDA